MAFAQAQKRIIPGAVATVGVSDRVAFLRRTYGTLGVALLAFAGIAGGMMRFATDTSLKFSMWAMQGRWSWAIVMILFMVIGWFAERLAKSNASRGTQYAGLAVFVAAEALILQPLLWVALLRFGGNNIVGVDGAGHFTLLTAGPGLAIIGEAALITMAIFIGLTATVFLTKKDFSFMRGALAIGSFAVLGVIIASMIFGFHLGALFCGVVILLMAGYILFQTSVIMREFPPTFHVAAALMLFSTIATLFWYVLRILIELKGDR